MDALAKRNPIIHPSICRKNKLKWLGRQTKTLEVGLDKLRKIMKKVIIFISIMSALHISAQESKIGLIQNILDIEYSSSILIYNKIGNDGFKNLAVDVKNNPDYYNQTLKQYLGEDASNQVIQNLSLISSEARKLKQISSDEDITAIIDNHKDNLPVVNNECYAKCTASAIIGYASCATIPPPADFICALAVLYIHVSCNGDCRALAQGTGGSGGTGEGTGGGKIVNVGDVEIEGGPPGGGYTGPIKIVLAQ